ncbi:hypothetical protein CHS0354_024589 [Potamilus streckersoni]|uniref:Uncharacterized protein n=1 Tax=Potamilus streckersoni TaxID=2493646 RepID=A0AAE0VUT2_9BIVA|nr:hypothetical protein CHS0354_024589 [Potamilus streckersoni]
MYCSKLMKFRSSRFRKYVMSITVICLLMLITTVWNTQTVFQSERVKYSCDAEFGKTLKEDEAVVAGYSKGNVDPYKKFLQLEYTTTRMSNRTVPVIGTAASANHFEESMYMMQNLQKMVLPFYKDMTVLYYDLGLTEKQRLEVLTYPFTQLRTFPFDKFPDHVKDLFGYTWKPLIIQILLNEFGFVMWIDASVRFRTSNLDALFSGAKEMGIKVRLGGYPIAMHTDKDTFDYLEEAPCLYQDRMEVEANFMIFFRTPFLMTNIIKPLVSCALSHGCMVTKNSASKLRSCSRHLEYFECHRFDQSVLSIILTRLYHNNMDVIKPPQDIIYLCRAFEISFAPKIVNQLLVKFAYTFISSECHEKV